MRSILLFSSPVIAGELQATPPTPLDRDTRAAPTGVGAALVQEGWRDRLASQPAILRSLRRKSTKTPWWSWRESNPRPSASNQGFSGCSQCCRLLSPGARTDTSPTGSATEKSRTVLVARTVQQAS